MKFRALKRKPVEENGTSWVQEPSAGLLSSFGTKVSEFPRLPGDGDRVSTVLFSGGRILSCLFEGDGEGPKNLALASLINNLHAENPTEWPITVLETDSPRQILDALETNYFVRVVDWFIDQLPAGEFTNLLELVREVWPEQDKKGNA